MKDRILQAISRHSNPHVTRRQLAELLGVSADEKPEFRKAIRELQAEGRLLPVKKNYYAIRGRARVITGKLQCNRAGFGFVLPDPECQPGADVFIPAAALGDATHGDRVMVELADSRPKSAPRGARDTARPRPPRLEGRVVRVLERGTRKLVGKYVFFKKPVVIPLDSRYHYSVSPQNSADFELADGDIVMVEMTTDPSPNTRPQGLITALVGRPGDPELPLKIALHKHGIPTEFPPEALREAAGCTEAIAPEELARRTDFRHLDTVTIDGETAFDFDDAVNVEKIPGGQYRLYVHIADVAHYVRDGGAMDLEAFRRGPSVYFPARAVSMLPEAISGHICSLLPDRDRLAFTATLTIDGATGETVGRRFELSVIRSRARMTYTAVARILDGDEALRQQYGVLAGQFDLMAELTRVLLARRQRRGAIDFELPEEVVRFGADGQVEAVCRTARTFAHRVIEEFMLAANEAVAEEFQQRQLPSLYRIHDLPDPLKVQEFAELAVRFGYRFDPEPEELHPAQFQELAVRCEESAIGRYLSYLMLRTFKLAVYSENNIGHFGLAAPCYTHFTSPIRRYPALGVHRLLRLVCSGPGRGGEAIPPARLREIAAQSSDREREAMEAEREVLAWKKAEFMSRHLGEDFEGFVSSLKPGGFFVELADFAVEGFVSLSSLLDDYYIFDEDRHLFYGERSGSVFRLGTRLVVQVERVDLERFQVFFGFRRIVLPAGAEAPTSRPDASRKPVSRKSPGRKRSPAGPEFGKRPRRKKKE